MTASRYLFTDEAPNGVKVSECITLNLHPSCSLTPLLVQSLPLLPPPLVPSGYRSVLRSPRCSHLTYVASSLASSTWSKMTFKPSGVNPVCGIYCQSNGKRFNGKGSGSYENYKRKKKIKYTKKHSMLNLLCFCYPTISPNPTDAQNKFHIL